MWRMAIFAKVEKKESPVMFISLQDGWITLHVVCSLIPEIHFTTEPTRKAISAIVTAYVTWLQAQDDDLNHSHSTSCPLPWRDHCHLLSPRLPQHDCSLLLPRQWSAQGSGGCARRYRASPRAPASGAVRRIHLTILRFHLWPFHPI